MSTVDDRLKAYVLVMQSVSLGDHDLQVEIDDNDCGLRKSDSKYEFHGNVVL